jgi:hypothetical protein
MAAPERRSLDMSRNLCDHLELSQPENYLELIMTLIAYGVAINTALRNPRTKLEDLKALREHARSLMKAQGDLKGALGKLEKEIKTREKGTVKKKAAKKKTK